jgi:uncharacterized LabA/DUF88 family protein
MVKRKKKEIVYAFIDSQNLNLGIRKGYGWKLDFAKFRIYLQDKYKVSKAYLFIGNVPGNESLYGYLQNAGYILILKPTLEYRKGKRVFIKGNVDAELVLHVMIEYPHYDKAIIVTGDGDFYCLLDYLSKKNKLAMLLVPNRKRYSALLRKFLKKTFFLGGLRKKLEQKTRGINLRTKP